MSSYSYINSHGEAEGRYKGASPAVAVRKMFKQIYMDYGKIPASLTIKKNDYSNSKYYKYAGKIMEYKKPVAKKLPDGKIIYERYKIAVKRIQ